MWAIKRNNTLIACHEDEEVLLEFSKTYCKDPDSNYFLFHVKKKELKNNPIYNDIYLVRYKHSYIPFNLYDEIYRYDEDNTYDYKYTIDILLRLIEEDSICKNDKKSAINVIRMLMQKIDEINADSIDEKTLYELKRNHIEFKNTIK